MPERDTPEFTIITREIRLGVPADELWALIGDGDRWRDWMVDDARVDITPGGGGEVVDDGEARVVEITEVDDGAAVGFVWWPHDRDELASSVSLTVDADADGLGVLRVVEVFPPEPASDHLSVSRASSATLAWEVRAVGAWLRCRAGAPSLR